MITRIDLRKTHKYLYTSSHKQVTLVEIPEFQFVMITGKIEPGKSPGTSPSFKQAMEALYGIAYTLKFMSKLRSENPIDYTVMGLEALWWVEDGLFDITKPDNWCWNAMILQPEHITDRMFREAKEKLKAKKNIPAIDNVKLEKFHEGRCIQIMHIGPYATEPMTVKKMQDFANLHGYVMHHKHHEIYLGNPLRSAPEKLKTILRHPITRV